MPGPAPHPSPRPQLSHGLQQRTEQHMLLLPQMLQSIEVLALPAEDLEGYLRSAYEQNEALALRERDGRRAERAPRGTLGRERTAAHDEILQNHPARAVSLPERVDEQLALIDLDPGELEWLRLLISCLDASGYLSIPDEDLLHLAEERGLAGGAELLGRAIARLQALEPRGIGARNLVEALLLQLDPRHADYALTCRLLEEYLDDLARNKLPKVARELGLSMVELEALLAGLQGLDPRPAAGLAQETAPGLRPDVILERSGTGFRVRIDHSSLPDLSIDESVRELARGREQPRELRRYLRGRMDQARFLIQAVEQRRATLLRVCRALFARQRAFLEHGPGHMSPLRMGELADELSLHVSTISRAVGGKHAQTPWGVLPLRQFFQAAGGASEDRAREDVREIVKHVVEAEDSKKPLSDDEIVEQMRQRGFELARRTVAKYRTELGVPSSYRRRKY